MKNIKISSASEKEKALIKAVERHNEYCYKVGNMMFDAKCGEPNSMNLECVDTMRQGNIEAGIELCCEMRELNIDAVVDMIWGYVLPKSQSDDSEVDGKPRYCSFEWVEKI